MPHLEPPEDKTITTLYVGGLDESVTDQDIRNSFYAYGEIRQITMVPKQGCAFVQFTKRASAELAADKTFNKLIIRGLKLTIRWGKSQGKQSGGALPPPPPPPTGEPGVDPVPGLPGALPAPPVEVTKNYFGLAGPSSAPPVMPGMLPPMPAQPLGGLHYPSQDPSRMGASSSQQQQQQQY